MTPLRIDVAGYEGPIDLLLDLARTQKVDLRHVCILELVRQYLAFIEEAQALEIVIAADYMVMAAWLIYLKSRLLLPDPLTEEAEGGETLAALLAFRLRQLESMQTAAKALAARPHLGRDVFARGAGEDVSSSIQVAWRADLHDLLSAYGAIALREEAGHYDPPAFHLMPMDEAMERMTRLLRGSQDWQSLERFLPPDEEDILYTRSALAALLVAGLELTRQGAAHIRQEASFSPVYVRENF